MTATALAELRRKPLASYSGPGWGEQMWQKPTVRHKTVASHWFVICKIISWCGFQPLVSVYACLTLCARARLVDVRLQDVMPELQCLLSGQLSCLSAEPEGQESVATPGNRDTAQWETSVFFSLHLSLMPSGWLYLGSQRNRSSWPSSLHMSHSLKEVWFSIRLPSLRRNRNEESCSRRCENSAHSSEPPARVPAFTTSNSCASTVLYPLLATISMLALTEAHQEVWWYLFIKNILTASLISQDGSYKVTQLYTQSMHFKSLLRGLKSIRNIKYGYMRCSVSNIMV